jgi:hypothetical protein
VEGPNGVVNLLNGTNRLTISLLDQTETIQKKSHNREDIQVKQRHPWQARRQSNHLKPNF